MYIILKEIVISSLQLFQSEYQIITKQGKILLLL
jgi:hypothetical protein